MDRLLFVLFPPNHSVVGQLLIFKCSRFSKVRQKFPLVAKNFLPDLKFPPSQATVFVDLGFYAYNVEVSP